MRKFLVSINGNQYEVGVEEIGGDNNAPLTIETPVQAKPVEIKKVEKQVSTNGTKLTAPMPGMIKGYKVSEGATVKEGDVVLVLEAMKMDNDITAPCSGVISFKASVGSNVDTGDVMAIIG